MNTKPGPRPISAAQLRSPSARAGLLAQSAPYWLILTPGRFLGYWPAKNRAASSWRVRLLVGGKYHKARIATADDYGKANGLDVLSFQQAIERAHTYALPVTSGRLSENVKLSAHCVRRIGGTATVDELVREYFDHRSTTPSGRNGRVMNAAARMTAESQWRTHGQSTIGLHPADSLTAADIRRWHSSISQSAPLNRGKVMTFDANDPNQLRARRETANRVLTILKAALNLAWAQESLPNSINRDWWNNVQKFHSSNDAPPRMLDEEEVRRLLNSARSYSDLHELIVAALMTGARAGELRALLVENFSEETGRIRINQGKTGKVLTQPLTASGVEFFRSICAGRSGRAPMLRRADGGAWQRGDYRRRFAEVAATARLENMTFKVLRSTYGKLLLIATRDIELVAKALGHSDSRITRRHYAQYLPDELARGISQMPSFGGLALSGATSIGRRR
ncbi:MAG TPA: tyrosine-type recombinase/integrase [Lysobacter sp.]